MGGINSTENEAVLPPGARDWIWLRHERSGLWHELGSDWDVVADDPRAGHEFESAVGEPDLRIGRQYVTQRFYPWGQLDLLPGFEWNGIEYLERGVFFAGVRREDDGLRRPRPAHDAFVCWMTQVLWGARYREKYDGLLAEAWRDDRDAFERAMNWAFGRAWAEELGGLLERGCPIGAAAEAKGLRRALAWQAFRRAPGEMIWRQLRHWWIELMHHLHPPFPWVAILGPDGSGKSTVIQGVTERLAERRLKVLMLHWRPQILWKADPVPGGIVPDPHSKPPRGVVVSALKLIALGAEWWMAHLGKLRHARAKDRIVVSDRFYADLLVDQCRYRFGAPVAWAKRAFRCYPQPDRVICLVADAETIHARKQEVTFEELERQLDGYRNLARDYGDRGHVVNVARSVDEIVEDVCEVIFEACLDRRRPVQEEGFDGGKIAFRAPEAPSQAIHAKSVQSDLGSPRSKIEGRLKVLASAYACSPVRGAEANVAWNLVRELSARHDFHVLTRTINRSAIEGSSEAWVKRVRWVYFDPPKVLSFWRQGQLGVHPFYLFWQWLARRHAQKLMGQVDFDVVHHLTFGTYVVPSPLSDLGVPLLFGPVGGGEGTPGELESGYSLRGRWEEAWRGIIRRVAHHMGFLRHWYDATAWTLAATPGTETALRRLGVERQSMMLQSAVGGDAVERFVATHQSSPRTRDGSLRLVTASRLVHWKGVDLGLEAVALARSQGMDLRLTVLQEGPEEPALREHVSRLGLDEVVDFVGRLPTLDDVFALISEADGLLHPALHEAFGQACLEALALGVPVICLDWGGPGLIVNDQCGFKVRPGDRDATVAGLAGAIHELASCLAKGEGFEAGCRDRAAQLSWSGMAERIEDLYAKLAAPARIVDA